MWSPILRGMCQLELLYMQADCISCDRASMSQKKRRIWGTYIILILNYNQNKIELGCSIFKCTSNLLRLCVYYYPIFFPLKSLFSFSGQLLSERPWAGGRHAWLSWEPSDIFIAERMVQTRWHRRFRGLFTPGSVCYGGAQSERKRRKS